MGPKWAKKGSKRGQKWPFFDPFLDPFLTSFGPVLDPFRLDLARFWGFYKTPFEKGASKRVKKRVKNGPLLRPLFYGSGQTGSEPIYLGMHSNEFGPFWAGPAQN